MFVICEHACMDIASLRTELGLSMEAFAAALGLKSRGQAHDLEAGKRRPSVRVALEIERLSDGRLRAADLNPDVALVEAFRAAANDDASPQEEAA
jgi:transcriptional regulator with XRE-family HTH domain